ncbi:hypothetical protein [Flavobacterium fluviatile]|uniref:hypothetical protein n=1 Tax=Flavobacterium fluviatile TaxID=1862387 RepID=UPI0013CFA339|nr:hypothetical protein [Flavobacterium fluviatile]
MKAHINSKYIILMLFLVLLFSCKNNISGGVGSDGKSLDSVGTNTDTTTIRRDTSKILK